MGITYFQPHMKIVFSQSLNKKNKDLEYKITDLNTRCDDLNKQLKKEYDNTLKLKKE